MTTLLTGATGFVGAAVLRALVRRGHAVRALVRAGSDRRNLEGVACELVEGSYADPDTARRAVEGCDTLFHVAADYRLWVPDPAAMYAANVEGTETLLRAARHAGVERAVYTSSVATLALGPAGAPANEQSAARLDQMIGHYKRSKFMAEERVRGLVAEAGIDVVIVQPAAPVGPRDIKPTPTGCMVLDAARGRTPAYVDTGLNVVHVDDVAEGHCLALEYGVAGERYILGGENLHLREILTMASERAGRAGPRIRLPHRAVLPVAYVAEGIARLRGGTAPRVTVDAVRMAGKRMYFSSEKAARELGYRYRPASEAIADAVDWFTANGYVEKRGY